MRYYKIFICVLSVLGCIILVYSCKQVEAPATVKTIGSISIKGNVRELTLDPAKTDFPDHPGKTEFVSYCAICHSLKYISMQPNFPRKTWDAEVHKMIEKFGAPIDTTISKKIVDYLVAIKSDPPKSK